MLAVDLQRDEAMGLLGGCIQESDFRAQECSLLQQLDV